MNRLNLFLLTIWFLTSCQSVDTEKVITIDNKYSISIPSFLTKVSNLNEDASLQYQHALKEFYVIVIDEPKEELLKALMEYDLEDKYSNNVQGYANLVLDNFERVISVSRTSDVIDTLIREMPARVLNINGTLEDIGAYYSFACVEGENHYYQILTWTLSRKENQYKEKMKRIIYSFREI